MKLSEALDRRADLQRRVQSLGQRIAKSALVQEGEQPAEDPQALFAELNDVLEQLQELIGRVNRTNLSATLESGATITHALAQRDVLKLRISVVRSVAEAASGRADRYSRSEIRSVATVDVGGLRRQADQLS